MESDFFIRLVFKESGFECKNFLVNNGEIHMSDDLQFANVKSPVLDSKLNSEN